MKSKIKLPLFKLSIFGKLLVGIIAILSLITTVAFIGISSINLLKETSDEMLKESICHSDFQNLKVDLEQLLMPANDYLIHGNTIEKMNFEYLQKEVQKQLYLCLQHIEDEDEQELIEELARSINKIELHAREIFELENPIGNKYGAFLMEEMDESTYEAILKIEEVLNEQLIDIENYIKINQATNIKANRIIILVALFTAICLLIGGFFYVREITSPIKHLLKTAETITSGDLSVKAEVKTTTKDEIEQFARSFNEMLGVLEKNTVSRDYFNSILGKVMDALIIVGDKGKIRILNQAAIELLGYQENEIMGQSFNVILRNDNRGNGNIDFMDLDNVYNILYSKEGKAIPVLYSSSVIYNNEDKILGMICIASHNTEKINENDDEKPASRNIRMMSEVPLTKRELEIIKLITEGVSNRDIAEKLFISRRTVETHRRNIMTKLHTNSVIALVHYAVQNGII